MIAELIAARESGSGVSVLVLVRTAMQRCVLAAVSTLYASATTQIWGSL